MNPDSSITSVPRTTPATSGAGWKSVPCVAITTTTATNNEITVSATSFTDRYSPKRSGLHTTAPSVRSCFSKNTEPPMKKKPMTAMSPIST